MNVLYIVIVLLVECSFSYVYGGKCIIKLSSLQSKCYLTLGSIIYIFDIIVKYEKFHCNFFASIRLVA